MNVDEAWRRLGEREAFPRDALQWSLDHWEEAGPRFLAKLRAFASGAKFGDDEREALFWTIHLCAEKRDERAYAPLCRILAEYAEVWDWLGDALTESLHGILINVFDGDVEPLKQVVASSKADASSRSAALMTLGYLVRARGVMSDDEMRAYLGEIEDSVFEDSEGNLGFAWAFTIAALGYDSMMPAIARALSRGALYDGIANFKDYHADLQRARQDPDRLAAFRHEHVEPFGSTIDTFEPQARERERREQESLARNDGDLGSERGYVNPETPYINPLRTVGRNDPCPCGSGKKYKKCCLAA